MRLWLRYPKGLIVIGAYYVLFALLAPPSERPLVAEIAVGCVFLCLCGGPASA